MGGIRTTGISVECDRCKKAVVVTDQNQADFYRAHSERGEDQRDVSMFIGLINNADGEVKGINFEYLCPKCCDAILTYMIKIDPALSPPKDDGAAKKPPEKPVEKKTEETAKPKKAKKEPSPPEPENGDEFGSDYVDEELFT